MTGHLDGTGLNGNLHIRNNQIRDYCNANNKILYDFADIETWDPDFTYFGNKIPNDNCDYDSDGNLIRDSNWAIEWQNAHIEGVDWYNCPSAHSQPLNANQKAYAAWWLWSRLAGWNPITGLNSELEQIPTVIALNQNYPNPFNPATIIKYSIPGRSFISLKIYDVLGNEISTIVNEEKPAGSYEIEFAATNLPSGVYFYQLKAGDFIETKKMVLMK
ncbi:MAG: T9SS type A sorting domain-containing protein [Ignavibacteria bacterium]|nr:T9SS type A sorting domain-containing protein [Ignavibacteria bacterium]MBT8381161.1 T9SS type A sorting domain-containing protein [Ignavibacteria bacterium]MBT8390414.1 T9SS type A sorting domain-containing protein [Ignavibacteria bacterium]NNJ52311.1 T9SS type A sorting domain-containing protein [Ignavibacteriaceae bacterium]NNL21659.1 T9SS type A sorting domain-containing protein [Ignavibacteriaceae bacterium]